jgi:hypothetical protein
MALVWSSYQISLKIFILGSYWHQIFFKNFMPCRYWWYKASIVSSPYYCCSSIRKMPGMNPGMHYPSRLSKWWKQIENLVASSSREQCIRVSWPVEFRVLHSLCDTRAQHYGLTYNMNFLVLDLLLEHLSLWVHLLDMAVIDLCLDLTRACGKNVWSFPAIGAWTSLH